ncbi:Lateral organ boundaries domain containing protein [Parasponia andersonii]|uniref:Lateral organ boundaries domain containing protein n=1 Tax=Parasponia andersonii TaxID=3476 RepID=A0A2P5CNF8_PARAD|nr:Lateral organ boundaries domain containing protein [Parasponia andersonii]
MTGSGSPCGACKFLRRKCVRGCVFAPYFCHEQGATHFAAIHKVFGASNVSKLLAHLPVSDRPGAAITISYEAQARLKDPIYGCVSHIFALQQQVINLQAQLASIKEQAAHSFGANGSASGNPNEKYLKDVHNWFQSENSNNMVPQISPNMTIDASYTLPYFENKAPLASNSGGSSCENSIFVEENNNELYNNGRFDEAFHFMSSLDSLQTVHRQVGFQDYYSDDLQSVPFSYARHS